MSSSDEVLHFASHSVTDDGTVDEWRMSLPVIVCPTEQY